MNRTNITNDTQKPVNFYLLKNEVLFNMKSISLVFLALCLTPGLGAPKKKATVDKSDLIPIPDHLMEDYHQPSGTIIDNSNLDVRV